MALFFSVRFIFGGDHGKMKYGPPDNYSPCYECLRPKQKLRLEPCFQLGDLPKGLLVGPAEIRDLTPFVPHPVDTTNVSYVIATAHCYHLINYQGTGHC